MAYRIAEKPPLRIVGIRIPLTSDMEDNLRIVPEFWEASLQGKQFLKICRLSNGEPRGILGISVYKNPKEIYYYGSDIIGLNQKEPNSKGDAEFSPVLILSLGGIECKERKMPIWNRASQIRKLN